MSEMPNSFFLADLVQEGPLFENLLQEYPFVLEEPIFGALRLDELCRSDEEGANSPDDSDSEPEEGVNSPDASDSEASSVQSIEPMDAFPTTGGMGIFTPGQMDILSTIASTDICDLILQIRSMAVNHTRQEISVIEEAIKECKQILEEGRMRSIFRDLVVSLKTSLSDTDTGLMKRTQILRLNAADRIAVRPIFHRAGYDVESHDPMVTRAGLPRAISMPDGISALEDVCSISTLCEEFPENVKFTKE